MRTVTSGGTEKDTNGIPIERENLANSPTKAHTLLNSTCSATLNGSVPCASFLAPGPSVRGVFETVWETGRSQFLAHSPMVEGVGSTFCVGLFCWEVTITPSKRPQSPKAAQETQSCNISILFLANRSSWYYKRHAHQPSNHMTITIGEYTTRNGCRAIVTEHYHSEGLFAGVVLLPGGLTQVYVWWDSNGVVNMPLRRWSRDKAYGAVDFKSHNGDVFSYSQSTYAMLMATPSPFDITADQQKPTMKSPLKPGKYKTLIGNDAYVLQLPDGVHFKDKYGDAGLAVLFQDGNGDWNIERRIEDGRYSTGKVSNHDLVESVEPDANNEKSVSEPPKPALVQKQRLIKLPDGSWVDPTTVAAITIIQPSVLDPECFRYWIVVIRTSITEININCDSREEAQKLADDLAEKVNSIA